jgi:ATP-grasp domain, R2K clade family 3
MKYLVQENTFSDRNYDELTKTLDRLGLDYDVVNVRPFVDTLDIALETNNVFPFGSLKMARISKREDWKPGSLMTDNHDFRVYSKYYGENLLNSDSRIYRFGDEIDYPGEYFFVRPCEDSKTFNGQMTSKSGWKDLVHYHLNNGHTTQLNADTPIQVCSPKNVQKEFRFWVVKGEVVAGSLYRLGDRVVYDSTVDEGALAFCKEMVSVYQLCDAFCMDVCLYNNEYKIVECGCINCCGFYAADMQKLLVSIDDAFSLK